jgi:hypothetical protein
MSVKLILDTNVFYDLGAGRLSLADVRTDPAEQLFYSPIGPLEIAGKWAAQSFKERRAAAAAIISSGAIELPDTDTFLTRDVFGYTPSFPQFSFAEGVKAMVSSATMGELMSGVPDVSAQVVRSVSLAAIGQWRQQVEGDWVKDHLALQAAEIPIFSRWYNPDPTQRSGAVPKLKGKRREGFLKKINALDYSLALTMALQTRALLSAVRDASLTPTKATVDKVPHRVERSGLFLQVLQGVYRAIDYGWLAAPGERQRGYRALALLCRR